MRFLRSCLVEPNGSTNGGAGLNCLNAVSHALLSNAQSAHYDAPKKRYQDAGSSRQRENKV